MYYFSQVLNTSFEKAISLVTDALKQEGLGVLTSIDVQSAFKKKLDMDFRQYTILGACHPQVAYQMLQVDNKAGVLYPCNVVVQELADGSVEVSAVDPKVMFQAINSPQAQEIADYASKKMLAVMAHLGAAKLVAQA